MGTFKLPEITLRLVEAIEALRQEYQHYKHLEFTLDGNLIGDIGEAVAADLFDLDLQKNTKAYDALAHDRRTVQIKATGTGRGPAFRPGENLRADHLIFLSFDFSAGVGRVVFNGPESIALHRFPATWTKDQRVMTLKQIVEADREVLPEQRLPMRQSV
jgi:hypothetical protein